MKIAPWRRKAAEETVDAETPDVEPDRRPRTHQAWRGVLPALVFLFVALMFAAHYLAGKQREAESEYASLLDDLRVRSQQVPREARGALMNDAQSFARLRRYRDDMQAVIDRLRRGDMASGLPPLPESVAPQLLALEASWGELRAAVETVLSNERQVAALRESGKSLEALISTARLTLQEVYGAMGAAGAGGEQIALASRQLLRLERMGAAVARVLEARAETEATVERLRADAAEFVDTTRRLLGAGEASERLAVGDAVVRQGLERLDNLFANRARLIAEFVDRSATYVELRNAVGTLDASGDSVLQATRALGDGYRRASASHRDYTTAVVGFAALALACLLMLGMQLLRDARTRAQEARRREQESRERNRRNQDAILKLLDEMSELAEGNLTAYASVTEDVTGAIADAFNYAIDALKEMVSRINHTSARVADAAQGTRTRAIQLSFASDKQNAEIVKASAAIEEMARSIEQVSANAQESSEVANGAVATANKGATAVRETMSGMDDIRETIQETSKRLKRLGESSQEIGHMVGLIDDIADQTNVLALNAAIQASMAGESGRGFAVVADEVQRLAERAGQATKRIEGLVSNIQADTNEAIASMEKSTAGVVGGARLAKGAGEALDEIERVSQRLAELIGNISAASAEQATRAAAVAKTMSAIRHIAAQTRTGSNTTAKSVGNLVQLAEALKTSVAGFRLPETAEATVVDLHGGTAPRKASERAGADARTTDVHLVRG